MKRFRKKMSMIFNEMMKILSISDISFKLIQIDMLGEFLLEPYGWKQ